MSNSLQPHGLLSSSDQGILQARILDWVAISFSRGSSQPRDLNQVSALQAASLPSKPPQCEEDWELKSPWGPRDKRFPTLSWVLHPGTPLERCHSEQWEKKIPSCLEWGEKKRKHFKCSQMPLQNKGFGFQWKSLISPGETAIRFANPTSFWSSYLMWSTKGKRRKD